MQTKQKPRILAIETSCDETAISYMYGLQAVSHQVHTQAALHAEFGGVFPNLAKREHAKNLIPILGLVFQDILRQPTADTATDSHSASSQSVEAYSTSTQSAEQLDLQNNDEIKKILEREEGLFESTVAYFNSLETAQFATIQNSIDGIAVTYGPGLEPALWVGLSFAKALAIIFDRPLFPINHMEGHIASVIAESINQDSTELSTETQPSSQTKNISPVTFPAVALLISGGHTELVLVNSWHSFEIIGQTVDDAVGEAYDKVARVLGLPYPGGPEVSRLAEMFRHGINQSDSANTFSLPRPMLHSKDLNFSFSGLKTAVLYAVRDRLKSQQENPTNDSEISDNQVNTQTITKSLSDSEKISLAGEFEQAVIDVLLHKTKKALLEYGAKSLIIGGGVISNTAIREAFKKLTGDLAIDLFLPEKNLSTDNATMIGIVAVLRYLDEKKGLIPHTPDFADLRVNGNLRY